MMSLAGKVENLKKCSLFQGLPQDSLKVIALASLVVECGPGEILFREGDESSEAYVIFEGYAEIFSQSGDGSAVILSRLGPSDIFGEFAVLGDVPRTASVRTTTDFSALLIKKELFIEYIRQFPDVALRIMKILVHRNMATTRMYFEKVRKTNQAVGKDDIFSV